MSSGSTATVTSNSFFNARHQLRNKGSGEMVPFKERNHSSIKTGAGTIKAHCPATGVTEAISELTTSVVASTQQVV